MFPVYPSLLTQHCKFQSHHSSCSVCPSETTPTTTTPLQTFGLRSDHFKLASFSECFRGTPRSTLYTHAAAMHGDSPYEPPFHVHLVIANLTRGAASKAHILRATPSEPQPLRHTRYTSYVSSTDVFSAVLHYRYCAQTLPPSCLLMLTASLNVLRTPLSP